MITATSAAAEGGVAVSKGFGSAGLERRSGSGAA